KNAELCPVFLLRPRSRLLAGPSSITGRRLCRSDLVAAVGCRLSQPDNHLRFFSNVLNGFDSRRRSTLTVSVPVCSQRRTASFFAGVVLAIAACASFA